MTRAENFLQRSPALVAQAIWSDKLLETHKSVGLDQLFVNENTPVAARQPTEVGARWWYDAQIAADVIDRAGLALQTVSRAKEV